MNRIPPSIAKNNPANEHKDMEDQLEHRKEIATTTSYMQSKKVFTTK